MTPEQWQRVKSLFAQALDQSPAARDALLGGQATTRASRPRCGNCWMAMRRPEIFSATWVSWSLPFQRPAIW